MNHLSVVGYTCRVDGRIGHGLFGQDVLVRYRHKVGCFDQVLFQHGKKLHMNFLRFYTYILCKTKAYTAVLMEFAIKKKKNRKDLCSKARFSIWYLCLDFYVPTTKSGQGYLGVTVSVGSSIPRSGPSVGNSVATCILSALFLDN